MWHYWQQTTKFKHNTHRNEKNFFSLISCNNGYTFTKVHASIDKHLITTASEHGSSGGCKSSSSQPKSPYPNLPNLPTYLSTTYLPTNLPTYLPPTHLPTYLPTHLPTYLPNLHVTPTDSHRSPNGAPQVIIPHCHSHWHSAVSIASFWYVCGSFLIQCVFCTAKNVYIRVLCLFIFYILIGCICVPTYLGRIKWWAQQIWSVGDDIT